MKNKQSRPAGRRLKRTVLAAAAACITALAVWGSFTLAPTIKADWLLNSTGAKNLMNGVKAANTDLSGALTPAFEQSMQDFSARLFQNVYVPGKNTLISPLSASLALSMAQNGAAGNTLRQFQTVLGRAGLSADSLNRGNRALLDEFAHLSGGTRLSLCNSVWAGKHFEPSRSFLQKNADNYNAALYSADFSSPKAAKAMNAWISEKTDGQIPDLIGQTDPSSKLYLLNAIYFDAKWEKPFDKKNSYTGNFTPENGSTVSADYMNVTDNFNIVLGKSVSAALLPYKDGKFAMLCILPNEGVSLKSTVASLTADTIPSLLKQKQAKQASITLPKLDLEAENDLISPLETMGLTDAFEPCSDFSAMGKDGGSLFISSMSQKVKLNIDETGTRFVVATNIGFEPKSMPEPPVQLVFDRPFLAAVVDLKTGLPLLLFSVADPRNPG